MRIGVGGFQHETNTFAPGKATLADFERADAWPGLVEGAALAEALGGMNIPVSGFLERAAALEMRIAPALWCSAVPSAHVTDEAFECICGRLTRALGAALPLDGVYLDLHGAMVSDSHDDADGEVLRRVREVVGARVPLVASLDLHANVSAAMLAHADLLVSYRTYPHVDMGETGARAADLLAGIIARGRRPEKALRQIPFLIPLTWQYTGMEPMRGLMADVDDAPARGALCASFTAGFPPADVADCGPSVFAYADECATAVAIADHMAAKVRASEADFSGHTWAPDEAVQQAMRLSERGVRPVVLADTQDNPGAGGNADTTGLLRALVRNDARDAVLAVMCDPAVAAQAHAAGTGADIAVRLGAWSGFPGDTPFEANMRVEALADGAVHATGPFYAGAHIMLGPSALLRIGGVRVAVASHKCQAADQSMLRHFGVEPAEQRVLALKSSVHFRADFESVAGEILVVLAPGPNVADPAHLPYRRLRPGVRLGPMGLPFRPQPGIAESAS